MAEIMLLCQTLQRHPGMFWKLVGFLHFLVSFFLNMLPHGAWRWRDLQCISLLAREYFKMTQLVYASKTIPSCLQYYLRL